VGIERVAGKLLGGIPEWARVGLPLAEIEQITVQDLHAEMSIDPELVVVDVRRPAEWNQGHIGGAVPQPLDQLRAGSQSLDRAKTTAVHCKSGYRSAIACSLLQAQGFARVMNVLGGFDAWAGAGLAVAK
jgi:rhodanese-related sulfurtransferase